MTKHTKEYFEEEATRLSLLCEGRKELNKRKKAKIVRERYLDDLCKPTPIRIEYPADITVATIEEAEAWERRVREGNPERAAVLDEKRREDKKKTVERSRVYYQRNKEKIKAYSEEHKERLRIVRKIYSRRNKPKIQATALRRYTAKLQRTPKWYDTDYHVQIEAIINDRVRLDEETKTTHHIDHEIPLQGKKVSGLHVPDNLRIMDGSENMSKNNTWNPMNEIIMHQNDDGTYTQEVAVA